MKIYKWEVYFVYENGSESILYYDLDSLLEDLRYDLLERVRKSLFTAILYHEE